LLGCGTGVFHASRILAREVALVDELADALFAEIIVTLVDRNLINPSQQRTPEIEILDGKINLGKNLLGDIFSIVAVAQNAVDDGKDLGLVTVYDFPERELVLRLNTPDKRRLLGLSVVAFGL